MDWKILLDLVVSILLVATIGYAVMLNTRLTQLRKNRDDLAKIIVSFNEATVRAESSIPKLRKAADEAGQTLQERVEKAQSLRDDLAFMIERADTMANRLENGVKSARNELRNQPQPPASSSSSSSSSAASSGSASAAARPASAQQPAPGGLAGLASLAASANAPPSARAATVAAAAAASEYEQDDRSEAERELLRALQSMR